MRLYFVRHGETKWNKEGRIQGQADNPLNEQGRRQAQAAARCLSPIPFKAAFTSPMLRARETAEILLKGRECPLYEDDRLKEISYGEDEGQSLPLIHGRPDLNLYSYFHAPGKYLPSEGGESIPALLRRCRSFLKEQILPLEKEQDYVLIAAHGALIRGMICTVNHWPPARFWDGKEQKNCCVTVVICREGEFTLAEEALDITENFQERQRLDN